MKAEKSTPRRPEGPSRGQSWTAGDDLKGVLEFCTPVLERWQGCQKISYRLATSRECFPKVYKAKVTKYVKTVHCCKNRPRTRKKRTSFVVFELPQTPFPLPPVPAPAPEKKVGRKEKLSLPCGAIFSGNCQYAFLDLRMGVSSYAASLRFAKKVSDGRQH